MDKLDIIFKELENNGSNKEELNKLKEKNYTFIK